MAGGSITNPFYPPIVKPPLVPRPYHDDERHRPALCRRLVVVELLDLSRSGGAGAEGRGQERGHRHGSGGGFGRLVGGGGRGLGRLGLLPGRWVDAEELFRFLAVGG